MDITLLPVLDELKALYAQPRGMERFKAYLDRMTQGSGDIVLPIVAANPMAKTKAPLMVDRLLAMGGEATVAQACAEAQARLHDIDDRVRASLVVSDDLEGAWSDPVRMRAAAVLEDKGGARRGFVQVVVWTSEDPTHAMLRERTLVAAYRLLHLRRHGVPRTLEEALVQEARAAAFGGVRWPKISSDVSARVADFAGARDFPTQFAVLFGDEAAARFGYGPLGFVEGEAVAAKAEALALDVKALADALRAR